jgi:RNA 3'-terminal phosphate cyclase (ATP)
LFSEAETDVSLLFKGGTNVGMAPQIEYYKYVFKPNLNRFGADFVLNDDGIRKGYFPKGGGHVKIKLSPPKQKVLSAVKLEDPGEVNKITIFSSVAGVLPIKMAHAMVDGAKRVLAGTLTGFNEIQLAVNVKKEENAFGNGSSIVIVAETTTGCVLGGSGLGSPKEQAFSVGEGAAKELVRFITEKGTYIY